jgi:uncharacterized phage-associated protein
MCHPLALCNTVGISTSIGPRPQEGEAVVTADQVASVILARSGAPWMNAMQLQKLLYYVQSWHLAVTDEPLFPEHFKAWAQGPVVPQVWHTRQDSATRRAVDQDTASVVLDELSSNLVDLVLASYGSMTGDELSALTHAENPWLEARGDTPEGARSSTPLDEDAMATFYREHRRLGGRSAADLAAGGVHIPQAEAEPVDIDAILANLPDVDPVDEWGGANLAHAGEPNDWTPARRDPVAW